MISTTFIIYKNCIDFLFFLIVFLLFLLIKRPELVNLYMTIFLNAMVINLYCITRIFVKYDFKNRSLEKNIFFKYVFFLESFYEINYLPKGYSLDVDGLENSLLGKSGNESGSKNEYALVLEEDSKLHFYCLFIMIYEYFSSSPNVDKKKFRANNTKIYDSGKQFPPNKKDSTKNQIENLRYLQSKDNNSNIYLNTINTKSSKEVNLE